ncbi:prolyl 4-hydroxylase subunit alpha-2-like isoform X1 [Bradysia coprophila]|uniref:prolyl 4-hydroxylase subunit alpha-2-like isoform X1 n=1 Tax=Bradysia coprophila TaxID=38358 RepID=UPI00187DC857|nr:prolyl 4-hydroxylase subunit alpha-2-like isoform X1 [Bradysia coprophila]
MLNSIITVIVICVSQIVCSTPLSSPANTAVPEIEEPPAPYSLSSTYLTYLAKVEQEVYKEIKQYAEDLQERLQLAQAYLKDYEDSTLKGTNHLPKNADPWQRAGEATTHPLMAYRMVRRFSKEFQSFVLNLDQVLENKMVQRLKDQGLHNWPGEMDLVEATDALLRLHYVYDMDIEQFANGNIGGVTTDVGLTTAQIFEVAEYTIDYGYHTLAFDWLNAAESKMKNENCTAISQTQIDRAYARNVQLHDNEYVHNAEMQHLFIFNGKLKDSTNPLRMRDVKINYFTKNLDDTAMQAGHYKFLAMCNGIHLQDAKVKSKLKCWLDTQRNPYFTINPLKMELLQEEPPLLQIYDVITDKWIADLKKTATPSLRRPPPVAAGATPRSAAYAWLRDEHIPNTPLSRRIELITGLNVQGMAASVALQIASYSFGGHVSTHYDSLAATDPNDPVIAAKGDRVTTFLIYLNDVEQGGLTPFPILGTFVKPVKASAVLWYNALKNGSIDSRMLHGACPVIMGHKWIATKWTHLNENMWTRPCDLNSSL